MDEGCLFFVLVVLTSFATAVFTVRIYENKPSAMDVYQGKTTLEYKMVNGEKVDSCVIWKNKEE